MGNIARREGNRIEFDFEHSNFDDRLMRHSSAYLVGTRDRNLKLRGEVTAGNINLGIIHI